MTLHDGKTWLGEFTLGSSIGRIDKFFAPLLPPSHSKARMATVDKRIDASSAHRDSLNSACLYALQHDRIDANNNDGQAAFAVNYSDPVLLL